MGYTPATYVAPVAVASGSLATASDVPRATIRQPVSNGALVGAWDASCLMLSSRRNGSVRRRGHWWLNAGRHSRRNLHPFATLPSFGARTLRVGDALLRSEAGQGEGHLFLLLQNTRPD